MPNLLVAALLCASSAPMGRRAICCGPRGCKKKSAGSTVPQRSTAYCAPTWRKGTLREVDRSAKRSRKFIDSSIALRWLAPLEAGSCCPQALYLFVGRLDFLVKLLDHRAVGRIVVAQLIEHFLDGEFVDFSHQNP